MTTHKEALEKARKEFVHHCWRDGVTLSGAIELAMQEYMDQSGLVMVPYEPTMAMMSAVQYTKGEFVDAYQNMLDAAPDPFK